MNRGRENRVGTLRRVVVLGTVVVLAVAGCNKTEEGGGGDDGEPRKGGTVVFGVEADTSSFNNWINAGNTDVNGFFTAPVLQSLSMYTPDLGYEPQLLEKLPELASTDPQKVKYQIKKGMTWEDGTPVTADDVQATLDQVLNENNDIVSRIGYDKVKDGKLSEISADKLGFTIEFTEVYAPWRDLFTGASQPIMKKAAMEGKDFNTFLNDALPFASGPFQLTKYNKGSDVTLERNPKYGGKAAYLDKIVFRVIETVEAQMKSLDAGEIQVMHPQPQTELVEQLKRMDGIYYQIRNGPTWEHIDFNNEDPQLAGTEVRQALVYMLDRRVVNTRIAKPTDPKSVVLENVIYVVNQKQYEEHWQIYKQDLKKADELLKGAGYAKGPDGVWQKGGQRLSFTIGTTAGNKARELTEEILVQQWKKGGVEVKVENAPKDEFFERVPGCQYQIALFAYIAGPDPSGANSIYRDDQISCPGPGGGVEGGQNSTAYKNKKVTDLLIQTDGELDPTKRAALYNQVDDEIAKDPPTLPLFQKPTILVGRKDVKGLDENPTIQGPTWNADEWWLAKEAG